MKKTNGEIEVIEPQRTAMRIEKGDKIIEFSPELSQQICTEIIDLGSRLISGAERMTIEYFKSQVDSYSKQLDAYIESKKITSEERKGMLEKIEKAIDNYMCMINQVNNLENGKEYREVLELTIDTWSNLYIKALKVNAKEKMPEKTNWFVGLKNLFTKK